MFPEENVPDQGLHYYVLPQNDPVRALNILRQAAGLEPLPEPDDDYSGQWDPEGEPTALNTPQFLHDQIAKGGCRWR
jgi:hypothetical protein